MKRATQNLSLAALAYAVAAAELSAEELHGCGFIKRRLYKPDADWSTGGPIIEREKIELEYDAITGDWRAVHPKHYSGNLTSHASAHGDTALAAAMRAYARASHGDEVEIPDDLIQET